jgi:hypothetical protein
VSHSFTKDAYGLCPFDKVGENETHPRCKGWIYCMIVDPLDKRKNRGMFWTSLESIENKMNIIKNNLPYNKNRIEPIEDTLLDFD